MKLYFEELWDSSRVLDLARYFFNKYPYADDDQIMKAIKKQMTKEGSTLPSSDSEFRRAYFSARDEYDEDDMYDESLSKKRMNEAGAFKGFSNRMLTLVDKLNKVVDDYVEELDQEYYEVITDAIDNLEGTIHNMSFAQDVFSNKPMKK